jgi:hypothetical protein
MFKQKSGDGYYHPRQCFVPSSPGQEPESVLLKGMPAPAALALELIEPLQHKKP